MTKLRILGAACAAAALLLNLLLEKILMVGRARAVMIPGLLDFAPAWNRGVSFSLFWQRGDTGRYVLIAILGAVVIGVATLAWRAGNVFAAAGYGLIIGGALGNLLDRCFSEAVFDYLFLHFGTIPLFVFNFSDAAISVGGVLLVADALTDARAQTA